jgi:phosphoenolpyruvate phosphomutase
MAMFSEKGTQALRQCYHRVHKQHQSSPFHESASLANASFTDMLQELIDQGYRIQAVPIFKGWMEVDSFEEYQKAWAKIRQ